MANQMIALQTRNPQLPDPSKMTAQYATLMNMAQQNETSKRQAAQAQQQMDFAAAKEGREKEMQPFAVGKAKNEAFSAQQKAVLDFMAVSYETIKRSRSPEDVVNAAGRLKQNFPDPVFTDLIDQTVATLPADPSQFSAWKQQSEFDTLSNVQRLEQVFKTQNTGTEQREIAMPKYGGGAAVEVPGSRFAAAQGKKFIRDANGAVYSVDDKTGGGFDTPAPATGTRPSMGAPGTGKDTFKIMIGMESRGKQFAKSGAPLTSPKGAIGIAQIMPATAPEAAKLAGLPYDITRLKNDEAYNYALGEAYFEKQLRDFGGDERKAAAAYNAGPGAVRRAIAKGGPNGWINHVPRETQNYVAQIPGSGGAAPASGGSNAAPGGLTKILPGKPAKGDASPAKIKARDAAVQDLFDAVVDAQKKGHLVSEKNSYIANRATELRQGRPYVPGGTAQKTSLDNIEANAAQLLRQIIQEGTSGTLNAVAEQKLFLKGVGGADSTYETRLRTIRNFAKQNGIKLNEAGTTKPKAAPARTPVPRKASGGFTVIKVED